jgi:hypothetical protein
MKRNSNKLLTAALLMMFSSYITSCKKNNVDAYGSMNLKVVNAAPNSGPQSFTLVDQVLISGGLDFTDASDYISTNSGTRLVAQFKKDGTNTVYATGELWTANDLSFTVYLAGEGSSARVKMFQDDLSAPPSGKVRIKFIHLSDAAPSLISIKNSAGDNLVTTITRDIASGYSNVDPGTLSIKIYGVVSGDNIGNFDVTNLQAGKIYTLYLTGSTDASLSVQKVLHN